MKISKINEYSYSYAEYLVSDGNWELRCICNSVPLPNDQEPKIGMPVKMLYAFSYADSIDLIISKDRNYYIQKDEIDYFKYKVCGTIENHQKALVRVFDFIISLEYYYPNGFDFLMNDGYIEFQIDRFDCDLDI